VFVEPGEFEEESFRMLFRSTGLGKRELVAEIVAVKRQDDYLIMEVETSEPVRWKIRGGVTWKDLRTLLKAIFSPPVLWYLLGPPNWFKQAKHPGEF
jgi:hypothetical protein